MLLDNDVESLIKSIQDELISLIEENKITNLCYKNENSWCGHPIPDKELIIFLITKCVTGGYNAKAIDDSTFVIQGKNWEDLQIQTLEAVNSHYKKSPPQIIFLFQMNKEEIEQHDLNKLLLHEQSLVKDWLNEEENNAWDYLNPKQKSGD